MTKFRTTIFLLAVTLALASCRTPPPILTITEHNCVMVPDLTTAKPILLKTDTPARVTIDDKTACLQPVGETPRLYAVFKLPQESTTPYFLSVSSEARGRGVLAPYLVLLDANGAVLRHIAHDKFTFRGTTLNTAFHPQSGETYLLVASDPEFVGQQSSGIVASTQTAAAATGTGGFFVMTMGREQTQSITRAHSGIISVSAEPMPNPR